MLRIRGTSSAFTLNLSATGFSYDTSGNMPNDGANIYIYIVESEIALTTLRRLRYHVRRRRQPRREIERPSTDSYATIPSMRILVVDDCPRTTRYIESLLADAGHEVWAVVLNSYESAEDIVSIAELVKFDVATIGLIMPVMDGVELAERLRRIAPDTRLIAISACDAGEELRRTKHVDEYLPKPFEREDLLFALQCV